MKANVKQDRRPTSKGAAGQSRFPAALWYAAIFVATLIAYWPALQGQMLWDDANHLTKADLQSFHGLWRIWFDLGATQQYYPVLHSAFWLEHRLWGDSLLGYHLLNVGLHALSAVLLVWIMRRLSLPGAWLAGFLFALHPVYVEGVAWISEQKSTLSGASYLASALLYLEFATSRRRSRYFWALGLFVLALLSKSVTATLPAMLLVILWWREGRLSWKRDVLPLVPWFALAAPMGLFTAWVERTYIGASGSEFAMTFLQRILLAGRVIWFYAFKLLLPVDLMFSYPRWRIDPREWWQYLFPIAVAALAIVLAIFARRNRGPLASILIFAGSLFPVLGFFNVLPFRYSFVADHFQYLASLGLLVPLAAVLTTWSRRYGTRGLAVAVAIPAVLGGMTLRQSSMYSDDETLYRETLARNPGSWLAHNNLGTILQVKPGGLGEAIAEYKTALQLQPQYAQAHFNLASALSLLDDPGRVPEIISEYQAALRINPGYAEAHSNLGGVLSRIPGRMNEAIAEYETALRLDPDSAQTHANLGNVLAQTPGRLPEAIQQFETAVQLNPTMAELRCNLGTALSEAGRTADAIGEFETAIHLNPQLAEAHFLLGAALAEIPARVNDAAAEFQTALRIRPDFEPAQQALQQLSGK